MVLTGETCTPETRARIAAAFSGHIVELYSASEAGPIAVEGPDRALNVCEENVFLESPASGFSQQRPQPIVITPVLWLWHAADPLCAGRLRYFRAGAGQGDAGPAPSRPHRRAGAQHVPGGATAPRSGPTCRA
ncbi:MAG: hypothetical protein WDN06_20480 [Asticcacaulis sp.]